MVPAVRCGVDMITVGRMALAADRSGQRFLRRIFTDAELACAGVPSLLAVRFAAKEAFFKALGTGLAGGVRWHDFSLPSCDDSSCEPLITGRSLELLNGRRVLASVSSTSEVAIAVVFLEGSGVNQ
ncbi:MAG: hypothetical protein AVO35_01440 [Candidatus Aegiribacteria sp. MLS_C]|nr:MAG: hypothetical protein AVO35_01440 [Candidatus Aegiribacteria sp. MLS_C]